MDAAKVTQKLRNLVQKATGVECSSLSNSQLVAANAKYMAREASLMPDSSLQQAQVIQFLHSLCGCMPFISSPEGLEHFCSTCDKLLSQGSWAFEERLTILDLVIVAVALLGGLFKKPPASHKKLAKYLRGMKQAQFLSDELEDQEEESSDNKHFTIPFGTGARYRVDYVLSSPELIGQVITVKGWAKTVRKQGGGAFAFVELNDGSNIKNLQIVIDGKMPNFELLQGTGISLSCKGKLVDSPGSQSVEMQVKDPSEHELVVAGLCDQASFPIQKKGLSLEFLRSIAHLRPRTNIIGCVSRVRNAMSFATHNFFNSRGFLYVHTPILTASDCEGAGEMFTVTSKIPQKEGPPKDFFNKPAFLTVSGQLAVENYCCALSDVYTFGPTFRAENSHTSRHLAEFWMIEPEMAWAGLEENMECAESYLKYCIKYALDNCYDDLEFLEKFVEKGLVSRLRNVLESPFKRITYTEAVEIVTKAKKKFESKVTWGSDLQSEHERYICEEVIKGPVIVYNYPKVLKAFYMKQNDTEETVQAMDILVPKIGEVIGGSVREDRLDKLDEMIETKELDKESYWWYRDLRKYGSVPHAGFGLGFERLIMMVTGVENIRDVIPYPRWPGHAEF